MSGSDSVNQPGVYGTIRIPSNTTVPGAHVYSVSWIDSTDNLWLFGGADGNNVNSMLCYD